MLKVKTSKEVFKEDLKTRYIPDTVNFVALSDALKDRERNLYTMQILV